MVDVLMSDKCDPFCFKNMWRHGKLVNFIPCRNSTRAIKYVLQTKL